MANIIKLRDAGASNSSAPQAHPQGGVFDGLIPTDYNPSDPITLFVVQAGLVMALTRLLHWPLSKIREPQVIAEVLAGIILGPSVMGRIPGFSETIFPAESMPPFRLAANIGLILFLFIVGLETDLAFLLRNWRSATTVAALSMAIPFGLGVAVSYGLYQDKDHLGLKPASFPIFALFVGVALAITAFPVLCRILTSLQLLGTPVGVIVLTAGIANDVVGWVLLALCVALVNASTGLTALWVLLTAVGYSLFLAYVVRPPFFWLLRRTRSLEDGPTQGVVALTIFMVLASAFFTNIIGVHAIFGAFMVGLMCPHEGGFAIKLTEKIEDLISALFIPLFFALSGLNTNLGLLDSGRTWGFVVAITATAFFTKVIGGTLGARFTGMVWRESLTIGTLMSCKGLVELIVLNIGLQSQIISFKTFTMFVVMALVTTVATAPLVSWLYPPWYRKKLDLWKQGLISWDGTSSTGGGMQSPQPTGKEIETQVFKRLLIYLRPTNMSSLLQVLPLLTPPENASPPEAHTDVEDEDQASAASAAPAQKVPRRPLQVHAGHFRSLGERDSAWMKVASPSEYSRRDIILQSFSAALLGLGKQIRLTGKSNFVTEATLAEALTGEASEQRADFILVPWSGRDTLVEATPMFSPALGSPSEVEDSALCSFVSPIFRAAYKVAAVGLHFKVDVSSALGVTEKGIDDTTVTRPSLKRAVSGHSVVDKEDQGVVDFASTNLGGKVSIRVLYSGTADDFYAVRIAYQMAEAHPLDLSILVVSSESETAERKEQFAALRRKMADIQPSQQVSIEDFAPDQNTESSGSVTSVLAAAAGLVPSAHDGTDILYIIGRSERDPTCVDNILTSSRSREKASASTSDTLLADSLGKVAATIVSRTRELQHQNSSLLVVQSKKGN